MSKIGILWRTILWSAVALGYGALAVLLEVSLAVAIVYMVLHWTRVF